MKPPKWWRIALLVAIVGSLWVIGWATGLHEVVTVDEIRRHVAEGGAWSILIFTALFCLGQVAQISGHAFIAAAVLVWGWWQGAVVSIAAASLGAIVNFAFSRTVGGDARVVMNERLLRVLARLDAAPIRTMIVARLVFMTAPPLSSALALSGVRHRDHAVATVIGLVPSVLISAYAWGFGLDWFGV